MIYQKYESRKSNYFGSKTKQIVKKKDPVLDNPD
jgi:hypothetical protein